MSMRSHRASLYDKERVRITGTLACTLLDNHDTTNSDYHNKVVKLLLLTNHVVAKHADARLGE